MVVYKKKCILFVVFILCIQIAYPSYAKSEENIGNILKLNFSETVKKASDYSYKIIDIEKQIQRAEKEYQESIHSSNLKRKQFESIKSIEYTSQNLENLFYSHVKDIEYPYYSKLAEVEQLSIDKKVRQNIILIDTQTLYIQILDTSDTIEAQQELLKSFRRKSKQIDIKYKIGIVTELDNYLSKLEIGKMEVELRKLNRNYDNLMMNLKKSIGISLSQQIQLEDIENDFKESDLLEYSYYINQALANREEILKSRITLEVKERELNIMKKYLTSEKVYERIDAQQVLSEKRNNNSEAIQNVTEDIYYGYSDLLSKRNSVYQLQSEIQNMDIELQSLKLQYEKGLVALSSVLSKEDSLIEARISYKKEIRSYNSSLYKMDMAIHIGPAYSRK